VAIELDVAHEYIDGGCEGHGVSHCGRRPDQDEVVGPSHGSAERCQDGGMIIDQPNAGPLIGH
jgi:hypothetical protein